MSRTSNPGHNRPGYKHYVVDVDKICIDSGWEFIADATDRLMEMQKNGQPAKVMTKPRIGDPRHPSVVWLDPNDEASWRPRRNANPSKVRNLNTHTNPRRSLDDSTRACRCCYEVISSLPGYCHRCTAQGCDTDPRACRAPRANPRSREVAALRTDWPDRARRSGKVDAANFTPDGLVERLEWLRSNYWPGLVERGDLDASDVDVLCRAYCDGAGLKPKSNPRLNPEPDSAKAEAIYRMWHRKEPTGVEVVRPRGVSGGDVMVCVGRAFDIVYASKKWGKTSNDYIHVFDSKPKVYMLAKLAERFGGARENPGKTLDSLTRARNRDGQFAVAELARPETFSLDNGTSEGDEIKIHAGAKVYGATDKKTIIIYDPTWKVIVVKGSRMHFDERGIVF